MNEQNVGVHRFSIATFGPGLTRTMPVSGGTPRDSAQVHVETQTQGVHSTSLSNGSCEGVVPV